MNSDLEVYHMHVNTHTLSFFTQKRGQRIPPLQKTAKVYLASLPHKNSLWKIPSPCAKNPTARLHVSLSHLCSAAGAASLTLRCTAAGSRGHWRQTDALPQLWIRNCSTEWRSRPNSLMNSCKRTRDEQLYTRVTRVVLLLFCYVPSVWAECKT